MDANTKMCDAVAEGLPSPEMGGEAVHAAVEAVRASFNDKMTFKECISNEMAIFLNLLATSDQAHARRYFFFAERLATAPPKNEGAAAANMDISSKNKVGVIGAGTMGSGIATCFLRAGYDVTLVDVNPEGLARGGKIVSSNIQRDVKRGRVAQKVASAQLERLALESDLSSLSQVDLVVEAVFESMELKKNIFRQLDGIAKLDCILCTNTSTLDIDEIGDVATRHSGRIMGMHFFR